MPLVQKILVRVPIAFLAALLMTAAVFVSVWGFATIRKLVPHRVRQTHSELTGVIFQVLAMAFTVLLAFVVVISWQNFEAATAHVETEANCVVDLHRNSAAFPEPSQSAIRVLVKEYVRAVVEDEWPLLAESKESITAHAALMKMWDFYTHFEPATEREKVFFAASVKKLETLRETRRLRIVDSKAQVHPMLWFILILGGIITMGFTFFLGSENFVAHTVMASMLAVILSLVLFAVLLFDFPFTGSLRIGPETFRQIISY
jgi:hypothetical protein